MSEELEETSDPDGDALVRKLVAVPEIDPAQRTLEPGKLVAHFRIVAELGRGGMGVVYRAEDTKLGREVALKVLPPSLASDDRRRKMLVREARAAAAVAHTNIASVYELSVTDDAIALALEYVEGTTLRQRLRNGPIPVAEALRIAEQIATGLATAHAAGLVHRDLKPENVMVTADGVVKLLDFGLAQLTPDAPRSADLSSLATLEGGRAGTPAYMSPEQVVGEPLDARSDIFSFGVVLYEMLSGARPFNGASISAIVRAVVSEQPAALPATMPPAVSALTMQCLAKAPEGRPSDAAELGALLREATTSRGPLRWGLLAIAAIVAFAAVAVVIATGPRSPLPIVAPSPSASASSDTADESIVLTADSVVACPVWLGVGVREPSGWYGAAAADLTCDFVPIRMGLTSKGARGPAQLLGLPQQPTDGAEDDPFGSPPARARSLAAAENATVMIDGIVERATSDVKVTAILRRGTVEIVRAEARNEAMPTAVAAALDGLVKSGKLVPARATLTEAMYPQFTRSPEVALLAYDIYLRGFVGAGNDKQCRRLLDTPAEALLKRAFWDICRAVVRPGETRPPFTLDPASVESLSYAATMDGATLKPEERVRLREHVQKARAKETAPDLQAALADAEAKLWELDGDTDRMRALSLAAIKLMPGDDVAAGMLVQADIGTDRAASTQRWAETIQAYALHAGGRTEAETMRQWRHVHELMGLTDPSAAVAMSPLLIEQGQIAEARALAAELLSGPPSLRTASDKIFADLAIAEGSFGSAIDHVKRFIDATKPKDWSTPELAGINRLLRLSDVLGADRTTADALFDTYFVGADPFVYSAPNGTWAWGTMLGICLRVSPDRANRCMQLLEEARAIDNFNSSISKTYESYFTGARSFLSGDKRAAVRAWKRLDPADTYYLLLVKVDVFDEIGAGGEASAVDAIVMDRKDAKFRGATVAHVREARRAAKRGDKKRAAELAKTVIDAWGKADLPVPALDEMRALQ